MGIKIQHHGDFKRTKKFLEQATKSDFRLVLEKYGREGVNALSAATPVESGITASSWDYEIVQEKEAFRIYWTNSNVNNGVVIAVILQLGHGTGTGGYVEGRDYINPALQPVFDALAQAAWEEVQRW